MRLLKVALAFGLARNGSAITLFAPNEGTSVPKDLRTAEVGENFLEVDLDADAAEVNSVEVGSSREVFKFSTQDDFNIGRDPSIRLVGIFLPFLPRYPRLPLPFPPNLPFLPRYRRPWIPPPLPIHLVNPRFPSTPFVVHRLACTSTRGALPIPLSRALPFPRAASHSVPSSALRKADQNYPAWPNVKRSWPRTKRPA